MDCNQVLVPTGPRRFEAGCGSLPQLLKRRATDAEPSNASFTRAAYWYVRAADESSLTERDRQLFLKWLKRTLENMAEILRIVDLQKPIRNVELLSALESLQAPQRF